MSRNTRVALEDQLLAAFTEHGPLTTGKLRQLTGPHYQNARVVHGRFTRTDPNTQGPPARHRWETCPDCQYTETRELEGGWATPRVRLTLKRLERSGQVARVRSPVPDTYGGGLWIRLDPGPTQQRTRGLEP